MHFLIFKESVFTPVKMLYISNISDEFVYFTESRYKLTSLNMLYISNTSDKFDYSTESNLKNNEMKLLITIIARVLLADSKLTLKMQGSFRVWAQPMRDAIKM